jgi:uncharacterized Zn-binding protein involved in type VI secretion
MSGFPAARVTDQHTCPLPTHVGGPVLPPCQETVLVTAQASARILDLADCFGPPDPIAMGAATVLIGGLPAARLEDQTSHGGLITSGEPSVLIDEATVILKVEDPNDTTFVEALQKALARILPTPSGAEWLWRMAVSQRTIWFKRTRDENGYCSPVNGHDQENHVPTGSLIMWNPNFPGRPDPETPAGAGAETVLAHEMVHALHNAEGTHKDGPRDRYPPSKRTSNRNEERSTVGTSGPVRLPPPPAPPPARYETDPPDYSNDVPTENSFRDDLGTPRRRTYYPYNFPGGPPW